MGNGYFRMEVKLVSRTTYRSDGSVGHNSSVKAAAYVDGAEYQEKQLSAIEAGAYISGGVLHGDSTGITADYRRRSGVEESWVMLHPNAPKEYVNPEILWNSVESAEKASDATLYREWIVSFDKHTTPQQRKLIAEKFGQSLIDEGMVAVHIALHSEKDGNGNFHLHALSPHRGINEDGSWEEMKTYPRGYQHDENGERIPVIDRVTGTQKRDEEGRWQWKREAIRYIHDWNDNRLDNVSRWRRVFCDIENRYLMEEYQVSPLSYEEQGIDKIPGEHLGKTAFNVHKKMTEQVHGLPIEKKQDYLERILKEVQSEYRKAYYEHSRDVSAQKRENAYIESAEYFSLKCDLSNDLQSVRRYEPKKAYISQFGKSIGCRLHVEYAMAELIRFYRNQAEQSQQSGEETLVVLAKLSKVEEDLLIMFSSGYTASMESRLIQGTYDMKKELLKQLGQEIRATEHIIAELKDQIQEEEKSAIEAKLVEYRIRIQAIRDRRDVAASFGARRGDSGTGAGDTTIEDRAVEYSRAITEFASELEASNQRLGRASESASDSVRRISELETRGNTEEQSKVTKTMRGIGR